MRFCPPHHKPQTTHHTPHHHLLLLRTRRLRQPAPLPPDCVSLPLRRAKRRAAVTRCRASKTDPCPFALASARGALTGPGETQRGRESQHVPGRGRVRWSDVWERTRCKRTRGESYKGPPAPRASTTTACLALPFVPFRAPGLPNPALRPPALPYLPSYLPLPFRRPWPAIARYFPTGQAGTRQPRNAGKTEGERERERGVGGGGEMERERGKW